MFLTLKFNSQEVVIAQTCQDLRHEALVVASAFGMPAGTRFTLNGLLFKVEGVRQVLAPAPANNDPAFYTWLVSSAGGTPCPSVRLFNKYTDLRDVACPALDGLPVYRVTRDMVYINALDVEHGTQFTLRALKEFTQ